LTEHPLERPSSQANLHTVEGPAEGHLTLGRILRRWDQPGGHGWSLGAQASGRPDPADARGGRGKPRPDAGKVARPIPEFVGGGPRRPDGTEPRGRHGATAPLTPGGSPDRSTSGATSSTPPTRASGPSWASPSASHPRTSGPARSRWPSWARRWTAVSATGAP